MAYETLKTAIRQAIKQNGNEEITGNVLQGVLLSIVNTVGSGYNFAGVATPSTDPGTPDSSMFWIGGKGTYSNFGNSITIAAGYLGIFMWDGSTFTRSVLKLSGGEGIFDVTDYTGNSYASLSDALAAIPQEVKAGGMTIRYVSSVDNNYVQYRYMPDDATTVATFTNVNNWEGGESVAQSIAELGFVPSSPLTPSATAEGWKLTGNGLCIQDSSYKLVKYSVNAGDVLMINVSKDSNGVMQFQSTASVPTSGPNPNLVGNSYTNAVNELVKVPAGATYLIVSQTKTNTTNVVKKRNDIDNVPTDGSNNLVKSSGIFNSLIEIFGKDEILQPVDTNPRALLNNNADNYGYWVYSAYDSLIYDLSNYKGKKITIKYIPIHNSYNYCVVSDYTKIPSSYNPSVFDPLVLIDGGKTSTDTLSFFEVTVPNQNCYLIISMLDADTGNAVVRCPEMDIVPLADFKKLVYDSLQDINAHISKTGIFDVTDYTGNSYASLSDALAAIPQEVKAGGMTIRYVSSVDNNYVQYRYMLDDVTTVVTFTNINNWQGVDDEVSKDSKNLIQSGAVYDGLIEVIGDSGKLEPIEIKVARLLYNNENNYGYWSSWSTNRAVIFDLSSCKGNEITIRNKCINNSYSWCIVSDYTLIPSSYNPTVFDPLVLGNGGKVYADEEKHFDISVPNQNCFLVLSCYLADIDYIEVVNVDAVIEPLHEFKERVDEYIDEHQNKTTETNILGVASAGQHNLSQVTVGSALIFGTGAATNESSHEYIPVKEGEVYYLINTKDNCNQAAVTDANNIVVASFTNQGTYYGGLLRVEIPSGGRYLTWTTENVGSLGWYVKVQDKKYDDYLLYQGTKMYFMPQEIENISTNVTCTRSDHSVNGIRMIDCLVNEQSVVKIPVDPTKEVKKGYYLYIEPSQVEKIQSVAVNGNSLDVYSTFSYQDCFYLSNLISSPQGAIEISVTLKEGVTGNVLISLSSQMDVNMINKAVFCINFDSSWQQTADCGAYDYIFNTVKFPVTITGIVDDSHYDFEPMLANGRLEIGMYGGKQGVSEQCEDITEGCSMSVLNTHLDAKEDYYQNNHKIQVRTFGGRLFEIDRKIIFALRKYGFHSSRMRVLTGDDYGGANYGGMIINGFNIISRVHSGKNHGGVPYALKQQSAIYNFAHGLANNSSDPMDTNWTFFKGKIDAALQFVNNGSMLAMTFEQYYQTLKRFGLVANVC